MMQPRAWRKSCASLALGVGMGLLATAAAQSGPPPPSLGEGVHNDLTMCQGEQAENYCCIVGGGGGWGWLPMFPNEYSWNPGFRGFLYGFGLIWTFFGVAILSDAFMAGIEKITGTTTKVTTTNEQGESVTVEELVWNPAVANLTLLALGSSAPEIMMSCIEIMSSEGYFGAIGAPTVVGSASFNLFVITGLCMLAIPEGETRKIDGIQTFVLTSTFSVLAYLWVCVIVLWASPNIIEFWEALVTFLMFPALTVLVYCTDRGYFSCGGASKVDDEAKASAGQTPDSIDRTDLSLGSSEPLNASCAVGVTDDDTSSTGSGIMGNKVQLSASAQAQKKMANYRHAARGGMMGGGARNDKKPVKQLFADEDEAALASGMPVFIIAAEKISVLETVGMAKIFVHRLGPEDCAASVNFETCDGSGKNAALAGKHYEQLSGTLEFGPGETEQPVSIRIIHDNVENEDLSFALNLSLPDTTKSKLGRIHSSEVTIIDMDGPGIFEWSDASKYQAKSTDSRAPLLIERRKGATGETKVKVKTIDGTAKAGVHFEAMDQEVTFKDNVASKAVRVHLTKFEKPADVEDEDYKVSFFVELHESSDAGGALLGDDIRLEVCVTYVEEEEEEEILTWTDQFRQALAVNGGEDVSEASCIDLTMHYVSITWKILAAAVPPTHLLGGWATFWVSLSLVGIVTGIIGDIATIFSCIVGMDNEIAGIFLVALGTSLPDTFASIIAIREDDNADNAVGNVTGSNSVNVFLGLGMPWLGACIHWLNVWGGAGCTMIGSGTDNDCDYSKDYERYMWLYKYQGVDDSPDAQRPPDWRMLFKYVKNKNDEAEMKAVGGFLPEYGGNGGFVVIGGKLGFNTFLFTILCVVAFGILTINKCRIGHTAMGGPQGNKIQAGIFFTLWAIFIIMGSINVSTDNSLNFLK